MHALWPTRLIDQSLTTLWGDEFIEEAVQFVFTASVTGSKHDGERVHVHLMVHERTMAAAEDTPRRNFLGNAESMQAQFQLDLMTEEGIWTEG